MEEILFIIVLIGCLGVLFSFVFYSTGYVILSSLELIANQPLIRYFYLSPKKLKPSQQYILRNQFPFYQKLSPKHKIYFEHRVSKFIKKYSFHSREGFVIDDEVKILIAATGIMITFGMRNYLFHKLSKIIIYPDIYYSNITKEYHKGEYNPGFKILVFSWKHFKEGHDITNDNLNLGIHEFAHILHYQGLKKSNTCSQIFANNYDRLMQQVKHPPNLKRLIESEYFRVYAYTNEFEFVSVILEHFFESPLQFKQEFPELFMLTQKMIGFTPNIFQK